jgi:hypothetical protein
LMCTGKCIVLYCIYLHSINLYKRCGNSHHNKHQ